MVWLKGWMLVVLLACGACSSVGEAGGAVGAECGYSGLVCRSGYTCALGRCRTSCTVDTDCPSGACLTAGTQGVCNVPTETDCSKNPCPTGTLCASDNVCRNGCGDASPCPTGKTCVQGTCFDVPKTEVCNFVDDNGDGQVDEGFDWQVGAWTQTYTTTLFASADHAITLKDGRVLLQASDNFGGGHDSWLFFLFDAQGGMVKGPLVVPIPLDGYGGGGLVQAATGEILFLGGGADYGYCSGGAGTAKACPIRLLHIDPDALAVTASSTLQVSSFDALSTVQGFEWTQAGYVTVLSDHARVQHAVFMDGAGVVLAERQVTATSTPYNPQLAAKADGSYLHVLSAQRGDTGWVHLTGLFLAPGSYGSPNERPIEGPGSFEGMATSRGLVAQGDEVVGVYTQYPNPAETTPSTTRMGRFSLLEAASATVPPRTIDSNNFNLADLLSLGGTTTVLLTIGLDPKAPLHLHRLNRELLPIPPRDTPLSFDRGAGASLMMARAGEGLLIFRGTYSGRTLDVARVSCVK